MSTGYQIYNQQDLYFLTMTIVDWVDIFTRPVYKQIVIDSLNHCIRHKGLQVYGYVIMTNHLHLLLRNPASFGLSNTVRDFKKFTGRQIVDTVCAGGESRSEWLLHRFRWNATANQHNSFHQIWQHDNHAVEISSRKFFEQRLHYIHQNPVRAGIVDVAEDYIYSSAFELSGRGNKLPVLSWDD